MYRVGYHNLAFHSDVTDITDNVAAGNHNEGCTVWSPFDGDRETPYIIDTSHGSTVFITITRTSDGGWVPDTANLRPVCLGLFKHNLVAAGCTYVQLQYYGTSGYVNAIKIDAADLLSSDAMYTTFLVTTLLAGSGSIQLLFNFGGGGPSVDLEIGEIFIGIQEELEEDPLSGVGWMRHYASSILPLATGGRVVRGRAFRSQSIGLQFQHVTSDLIDQLQRVEDKSKGATRPFMLHTHRHTGTDAWKSSGFDAGSAGLGGRGGVYLVQLDSPDMQEIETTDGIFAQYGWPLFRQMSEDEL